MVKPVKTVADGWVPLSHGSATSYNRGCRCDPCRAENRRRNTALRSQRLAQRVLIDGRLVAPLPPEKHGKPSTYVNWGCECTPCTDANTSYCRGCSLYWRSLPAHPENEPLSTQLKHVLAPTLFGHNGFPPSEWVTVDGEFVMFLRGVAAAARTGDLKTEAEELIRLISLHGEVQLRTAR